MADPNTIKNVFKRNVKALKLRPSIGQSTALTHVHVVDGTTCEIVSGSKRLTVDVGKDAGGNDAGPGPGILERAALGSCLAIGYATWAAYLEIPIDDIKVDVETEFDARGQFGVADIPPGFKSIRYSVTIESPASEEEIKRLVEKADKYSPVRDDFQRAIPIQRELTIKSSIKEWT
ncbi:OsmC family protein [Balneolaceae bacterium YR4-1]|uniref:OsmC family protein n=1 Tax=Halalkalibaculum roseum TaxID=2709311 RepID=A0A6M1SUQ8_9BACT|nr:OsmC family protein [Halalkalibaculum roseum]NGP75856.1 OsmC family protein [Halalkalibaculum roseum]